MVKSEVCLQRDLHKTSAARQKSAQLTEFSARYIIGKIKIHWQKPNTYPLPGSQGFYATNAAELEF